MAEHGPGPMSQLGLTVGGMLRAIITAVLVTSVAVHLGVPTEDALGYSIVVVIGVWYLWPALRRVPSAGRSARRILTGGRPRPARAASAARPCTAGAGPAAAPVTPALTQINHHHHYYGDTVLRPAGRPGHGLLGLPQRGRQQLAHDAVYTMVDADD